MQYSELPNGHYQCDECYKVLKTEKGIENHIRNTHIVQRKMDNLADKVEDIRKTSISVHEVIDRLQEMWMEEGIKVTFTSYPTSFRNTVSNTHNSPKGYPQNWRGDGDKPKGYPGWSGNWSGYVEVLDKERWGNTLYFSDLREGGHKGLPNIPWLKTGSGGGGENFRFDGMLFLYDFPEMHEQFKTQGGEFKVLEKDYAESVATYYDRFSKEQTTFIGSRKQILQLDKINKKIQALQKDLTEIKDVSIDYYKGKFCEQYEVKLPNPPSIFANDADIMVTKTISSYSSSKILPDLESTVGHIEKLSKEIAEYIENNPEIFI